MGGSKTGSKTGSKRHKLGIKIGAAVEVHRALGPGPLESAYQACLTFELAERGPKVERQEPLPVIYREVTLEWLSRFSAFSAVSAVNGYKPAMSRAGSWG